LRPRGGAARIGGDGQPAHVLASGTLRGAAPAGGPRPRARPTTHPTSRARRNEPPLILADEPTGALHTEDTATVVDLLRRFQRDGRTVVVVTHDPEVAASGA